MKIRKAKKHYYPIKCLKQETKMTCGVACARMLLDYYGHKETEKKLVKELYLHNTGTWYADLATLLENRGLRTRIYSINILLFNPLKMINASNQKIMYFLKSKMKNLNHREKKEVQITIDYIETGGEFKIQIPNGTLLRKWIKKQPFFIPVSRSFLYDDLIDDHGHYIVINGFDGEKYSVVDPSNVRKDRYTVDKEVLEYAWLANNRDSNGCLMVVLGAKK